MAGRRRFGRLRKLPSGRWQARYTAGDGADRPAPHTFATKRDASVWLTQIEADLARGAWVDPNAGRRTVGEWAERWLSAVSPHLKVKTRATYASLLRSTVLPRFGDVTMTAVQPIMVGEWVAGLTARGLSPSRVCQSYRLLSQVMGSAVDNGLLPVTPCRGVRLPRMPSTEPHILTVPEVERLAAAAVPPHGLVVQLLAYAGLRVGEAFALRRRYVNLDDGRLVVAESLTEVAGRHTFDTPKSHQRREVTLPAFVVDELRAHLSATVDTGPDALLFVGRTGRALHYNSWRRSRFDPAVLAAGLVDVTPHDLRATHATWIADAHGVMAAAKRLGHSNASVTTRHYARAVEGRDGLIAAGLDEARRLAAPNLGDADRARGGHDDGEEDPGSAA